MARHVFITGAGGYLGSALLQEMLKDENLTFYLLCRSVQSEETLKRRCRVLTQKRVTFVRGNVTLDQLGLSSQDRHLLEAHVNEVWHVAASTHFTRGKDEELELTNVTGTKNVLKLAEGFSYLDRFYAISTAYICGTSSGVVVENDLPAGTAFKNAYERTKFYSEQVIRQSKLPFVIIRPSIIMGHSMTGEAFGETRMFYGGLLAMYRSALVSSKNEQEFWDSWHRTPSGHFIDVNARVCGHVHVTKNMVTVDDVINVMMMIRQSPRVIYKAFNVVNKTNLSVGCIIQAMADALKITGFRLDPSLSAQDVKNRRSRVERFLHSHCRDWQSYLLYSEPAWETTNVDRLGVQRVNMTPELFQFLVNTYTVRHLAKPPSRQSKSLHPLPISAGSSAHG